METSKVKTIAYVLIVLVVGLFLGLAFMKFNNAAKEPPDTRSQRQKLEALENSPGVTSPAAKNFVQSEKARQGETKDVFDQVVDGR